MDVLLYNQLYCFYQIGWLILVVLLCNYFLYTVEVKFMQTLDAFVEFLVIEDQSKIWRVGRSRNIIPKFCKFIFCFCRVLSSKIIENTATCVNLWLRICSVLSICVILNNFIHVFFRMIFSRVIKNFNQSFGSVVRTMLKISFNWQKVRRNHSLTNCLGWV